MLPKMTLLKLLTLILGMSLMCAGQTGTTAPVTTDVSQKKLTKLSVLPTRPLGPAISAPQTGQGDSESGAGTWYQLPDAPSTYGYWDYTQPQMTFRKTATDPMFYGPFLGLLAANAVDIEATRASGCGEAHDFGRKPSRLSQYGQDYAADFAIGAMAFFLHRSHFRLIPQGMLGYGIAIHIRGAVRGFQANCHWGD